MAYTDLTQIQEKINTHKSNLAANLAAKSVNANSGETLAVLIGKVKDIEQTGGGGSGEGGLDWSQITDMRYAFSSASYYKDLAIMLLNSINCDMSQVTEWQRCFNTAINNEELNEAYQNANIRPAKLDQYMYNECKNLTNIEIKGDYSETSLNYVFYNCLKLPINKALSIIKKNQASGVNLNYALAACGQQLGNGIDTIEDFECNVSNFSYTFSSTNSVLKVGNITNNYNQAVSMSNMFNMSVYIEEIGLLTAMALGSSTNVVSGCKALKKFSGFNLSSQKYQGDIVTSSSGKFLGSAFDYLEELTNIPVAYLRYGGTNIANLYGLTSKAKPLRKLTFCNSEDGYYNKTYAKNLDIKYCSFDKDGMVEMFNTLPDASDVTATSTITITGNPCVTDGTLTEEDMAIATAKGYVVKTA